MLKKKYRQKIYYIDEQRDARELQENWLLVAMSLTLYIYICIDEAGLYGID